jgi:hypothetical protein
MAAPLWAGACTTTNTTGGGTMFGRLLRLRFSRVCARRSKPLLRMRDNSMASGDYHVNVSGLLD